MQDDFVALFAYDRWANTKVLDACRKLTAEQYVAEPVPGWSSVRSTIYHIALATEFNLRALGSDPLQKLVTPRLIATAVTYSAHGMYRPAMTHDPKSPSSPHWSPNWTSSSSLRPSLPSGGWFW